MGSLVFGRSERLWSDWSILEAQVSFVVAAPSHKLGTCSDPKTVTAKYAHSCFESRVSELSLMDN